MQETAIREREAEYPRISSDWMDSSSHGRHRNVPDCLYLRRVTDKRCREEESAMNRSAPTHCPLYCVDLAKHKFQVHGYSADGHRQQCLTLSRSQFDRLFC